MNNNEPQNDYNHLPIPSSFFPLRRCAYLNTTCFEAAFISHFAMGKLTVQIFRCIGVSPQLGAKREKTRTTTPTTILPGGSIDDSGNKVSHMGSELTLTDHRWPQQKSMIGALYYLDMYSSSIIEGSCVCAGDDVCVCVFMVSLYSVWHRSVFCVLALSPGHPPVR